MAVKFINCGVAVSSVSICRLHSAKFQSSHALFYVLVDLQFALGKLQPAPAELQPALDKSYAIIGSKIPLTLKSLVSLIKEIP